jgi:thioredoxin 1
MNRENIKSLILPLLLILSGFSSFAQHEIPDKIKDKIVNGINALESSKSTEDIDKAVAAFSEAAAMAPEYPDVHYYLGKTLPMMQGNAGRAVKELKKYLELYPQAPDKDKVMGEIAVLEEVIRSKRTSSLLGVEFIGTSDGIYVRYIYPFSPANMQFRVGDKITGLGKKKIKPDTGLHNFLQLVNEYPSGNIPVSVIRGGTPIDIVMNKASKSSDENIKELGEEDLNDLITGSAKPLAVVFWTDWSAPCRKYAPILRDLAKQFSNTVTFITVSLDENKSIAKEFGVGAFPDTHFYKDGKLFGNIIGTNRELIEAKIKSLPQMTEPFAAIAPQTAQPDPSMANQASGKTAGLDIKFPENSMLSQMGFGWIAAKDGVQVVMTFPNLPAEKLGMKKGDLILKVNETSVVNISQQDFKDIISSNKSVTFHLKRMAE